MNTTKNMKGHAAQRYLKDSLRTDISDISERPIIPSTKIILSKRDKLKIRGTKVYRQDYERRVREGLSEY